MMKIIPQRADLSAQLISPKMKLSLVLIVLLRCFLFGKQKRTTPLLLCKMRPQRVELSAQPGAEIGQEVLLDFFCQCRPATFHAASAF